jgi:hypothetical protein
MNQETVLKRIEELAVRGEQLAANTTTVTLKARRDRTWVRPQDRAQDQTREDVDPDALQMWRLNVLTILESSIGDASLQWKEVETLLNWAGSDHTAKYVTRAVVSLRAIAEDLRGGFFFEQRQLIEAEYAGDLLDQAEELLKANYQTAAAVVAGSVLERHLRTTCQAHGVALLGRPTMNVLNQELRKASVIDKLMCKQIDTWAVIRNDAAHGSPVERDDVARMIPDIVRICSVVK